MCLQKGAYPSTSLPPDSLNSWCTYVRQGDVTQQGNVSSWSLSSIANGKLANWEASRLRIYLESREYECTLQQAAVKEKVRLMPRQCHWPNERWTLRTARQLSRWVLSSLIFISVPWLNFYSATL
eukprot:917066-Pelagomonas_calceolata.AAC.3